MNALYAPMRCDLLSPKHIYDESEKCAVEVWLNPWKPNDIPPGRELSRENVNNIYSAQSDAQAGPLQQ